MKSDPNKMCVTHDAENEFYCRECRKLICLNCRYSHQKDHGQPIHLATLSTSIITQMRNKLDSIKAVVNDECDEIGLIINEYYQNKKYLYSLMKNIERHIVAMFQAITCNLTKRIQVNDMEMSHLKLRIDKIKEKYEQGEKVYEELKDFNMKKDYYQVYATQDTLKSESNIFMGMDFKDAAIRESSINSPEQKNKGQENFLVIPQELIAKKMELKKVLALAEFNYLKDLGKDMSKELNNINKRVNNMISSLKQQQNVAHIKNNPEPLIKKYERFYISSWVPVKSGKSFELELLYKGKRDGFKAENFHAKCDGKCPTITVIRSGDNLFGGYTSIAWTSKSDIEYKEDSNAFTFIFSREKAAKYVIQPDKKKLAVGHASNSLAIFGIGEIVISDQANENNESHAICGSAYAVGSGAEPKGFYATTEFFKVTDIEVYRIRT